MTENPGTSRAWTLSSLSLQDVNLIVGINASGKSKTVTAIGTLAWLISGKSKLHTGSVDLSALFEHAGNKLRYAFRLRDGNVIEERYEENGNILMERGQGGRGRILASKENQTLEFQTPVTELAVVARRDSIQHEFFEPLHQWAASLYRYAFGTPLGKRSLAILTKDAKSGDFDPRNQEQVVAILMHGIRKIGDLFKNAIKEDMGKLGYPIDDIGVTGPRELPNNPAGMPSGPALCLCVKERDLDFKTEQWDMSQGMFRALSVLIQINYSQFAFQPGCIIIDDIGEGLDFSRSCALIDLLCKKAQGSNVQLIMTTNDRFVMNNVPLEAWTILKRKGGNIQAYNYVNSKPLFDEFQFTGLSNFDFFAMDFVNQGIEAADKVARHEEDGGVR